MGTCDLPEMYALSPRAVPLNFGHTFQANHSCPSYNYKILTQSAHHFLLQLCYCEFMHASVCSLKRVEGESVEKTRAKFL